MATTLPDKPVRILEPAIFTGVATSQMISKTTVTWDPFTHGVHVIQCSAAFTVKVRGPLGTLGPPPKFTTADTVGGGSANDIFVLRGRWREIEITCTGDIAVWFDSDDLKYIK